MGTVTLSVALVSIAPGTGDKVKHTNIIPVQFDSFAKVDQLEMHLAREMHAQGRILTSLTYKGTPFIGNARLHHIAYASLDSHLQGPGLVAKYNLAIEDSNSSIDMNIVAQTLTGKRVPLVCRPPPPIPLANLSLEVCAFPSYPTVAAPNIDHANT